MTREPYQPRVIRWHTQWSIAGWDLKCYTISIHADFRDTQLVQKVLAFLEKWMKQSIQDEAIPEFLGFVILHEAKDGFYVLLADWINDNVLRQFTWHLKNPDSSFELISRKGWIHCIWELAVVAFEREAYVTTLLKGIAPKAVCRHQYLQCHLNTEL